VLKKTNTLHMCGGIKS